MAPTRPRPRLLPGLALIAVALAAAAMTRADDRTPAPVEFARQVAPLLTSRCLSCHDARHRRGGLDLSSADSARAGGDGGPAIVAGRPDASLLIEQVTRPDDGGRPEMPRKGEPLSAEQVGLLRRWIAEGAAWPDGLALRTASTSPSTEGKLWCLDPVRQVEPPTPDGLPADWAANPIDRFIFAGLRERDLVPSPEADRRTLIRRVSFDLTGLPPSPTEVEAFVRDERPEAYAELVDSLLSRSQYGERWARHWLDVARFAESDGFVYDALRDQAWPYRDHVIRSLNADKPYALFVREQIAGDVLEPPTADGIAGAGFLVAGPLDKMTSTTSSRTMLARFHEEEREEMVAAVCQTFLGLTVNCARCHDHKFDPIPQRDYYRIASALAGVRRKTRDLLTPAQLKARDPRSAAPLVYSVVPEEPEPTRVLKRGDVELPGETVSAGGLSAITTLAADFGLKPDAPEAERRRNLADWIADPRNPLTARVLVNRVWQHHFGVGLVGTPNDFGRNGERPSHPELLDWLAARFLSDGGRLKPLHRQIVLSRTYRQASRFDSRAASVDADDRLLWRYPPRRLEAEAVRDALLCVSGEINYRMGGPGYRAFEPAPHGSPYRQFDEVGPEFSRRSIYRMVVRSARNPLLEALDCPDPSLKAPRRATSTTPIQALALMNDAVVMRQARKLAERVSRDVPARGGLAARVDRAFRLVLGRGPTEVEREEAVALARDHGLDTVCWALFNSTEFVTLK